MRHLLIAAATFLSIAVIPVANADEVVTGIVTRAIASGEIGKDKEEALSAIAALTGREDARFGVGMIRLARSFETLAGSLYRYGFAEGRQSGVGNYLLLPDQRIFVNPNPEPIDYQGFRSILSQFVTDLDEAESALKLVGEREVKIPVDLAVARFDWNGDGKIDQVDHVGGIVADRDENGAVKPFLVTFDTADAKWMIGYTHLLRASAKFLLSHDFSASWDASLRFLFAKGKSSDGSELGDETYGFDMFGLGAKDTDGIADLVSLFHTMNWPVTDKAMWLEVRAHLKQVAAINRQTWDLIRKETDDDHEWLPGPEQKSGVLPTMQVTEERVAAWLQLLGEYEAVLDGTKLLPHWRFSRGINVAKMFEEPRNFDLVLLIAGPGALPYLQDGSVVSNEVVGMAGFAFEGNLLAYAFYFN